MESHERKISKLKSAARDALKKCGEVSTVAVHLTSTTTTLGKVGALLGVVQALVGEESLTSRYAKTPQLQIASILNSAILHVLSSSLDPGEQRGKEQVVTLRSGSAKLAWVTNTDQENPQGPWIVEGTDTTARALLGRAVWEKLGPAITLEVSRWGDRATLVPDDLSACLPSVTSEEVAAQIKLFNAAGISRAILFQGPPGSGKSFIMRDIARRLGGFSLRHQAQYGSDAALCASVDVLRPTTVLLDDLDRTTTSAMLDAVERLKNTVRAVLVSANYIGNLDPALRRPGRFDEAIFIDKLDERTFGAMTAGIDDETAQVLRGLPAAYISEYMVTLRTLGEDAAGKRLTSLVRLEQEIRNLAAPTPSGQKAQ